MTGKQFTAFVCAICVTILAVICIIGLISLSVYMFEAIDAIPEDNPASGSIGKGLGTIAYSLMWVVIAPILGIGALSSSGVGIFTSIAAMKAQNKGVRIVSIVLLSMNGLIFAVLALFFIIFVFV